MRDTSIGSLDGAVTASASPRSSRGSDGGGTSVRLGSGGGPARGGHAPLTAIRRAATPGLSHGEMAGFDELIERLETLSGQRPEWRDAVALPPSFRGCRIVSRGGADAIRGSSGPSATAEQDDAPGTGWAWAVLAAAIALMTILAGLFS